MLLQLKTIFSFRWENYNSFQMFTMNSATLLLLLLKRKKIRNVWICCRTKCLEFKPLFGLSLIHRRAVIGACGIKGLISYAYSRRSCNAEYFFQCGGNTFSVISKLILLIVIAVSSGVLPQYQYTKKVVLPVVTPLVFCTPLQCGQNIYSRKKSCQTRQTY